MGVIKLPQIEKGISPDDLADLVAKVLKEFTWLLDKNISNGNIRAKTIQAEKMDVDQLSAITANLGTITAGIIYGAYIATANGTYPRIEFSSEDNLLNAFTDANNYISIIPVYGSAPAIATYAGGVAVAVEQYAAGEWSIVTPFGIPINISSNGDLKLFAGSGYHVKVENWDVVQNIDTSQTLQQALNAKQNQIFGASGSFTTVDGKTVTVSNGIVTSIA